MKIKSIAGIDYSITCPAICIHIGKTFSIDNCHFMFLSSLRKFEGFKWSNNNKKIKTTIEGRPHIELVRKMGDVILDIDRFSWISKNIIQFIKHHKSTFVGIEGYSFGSHGKVFNIAENTGILKYNLFDWGIKHEVYPPTIIKKFATGKGNSSKEMMIESFIDETNIDLQEILGTKSPLVSPINDLVDSYWIAKFTHKEVVCGNREKKI